jgi:hypothetical protein
MNLGLILFNYLGTSWHTNHVTMEVVRYQALREGL